MAQLSATLYVSEEVLAIVEKKIAAAKAEQQHALKPLWQAQYLLAELIDEYQPPEPYWSRILELNRLVCQVLTEADVKPETL